MRNTRHTAIAIMIAIATLFAIDVVPASAITLQRTWTASMGSGGVNGRVQLKAYTNGVGSIRISLKGLKRNSTYNLRVRNGTCSNPGTAASQTMSFRTTSKGTAERTTNLLPYQMTSIWAAARKSGFIVRIASGSSSMLRVSDFPRCRISRPCRATRPPVMRTPRRP